MVEYTGVMRADLPTTEVTTWIDAPPERVWPLVSDVGLMPECSTELLAVQRTGSEPVGVGTTFVGHNRHEAVGEWSTTSTVIECTAPEAFAWAVEDVDNPAATWRFTLAEESGGTRLNYWMRMGPGPSNLAIVIARMPDQEAAIVHVRMCEFERNMTATVEALKERAER
jgi:ligand-binding SRPBCC domain-containing protein